MPLGQNLGLTAKVEPQLDKSSTRRMVSSLEKEIQPIEDLSFQQDGSFASRTTPGSDGSRGTGGFGTGAAAGAGARSGGAGLLSKVGGAGGAAVLGTVALGGVVATQMLQSMTEASGRMQAATSILGEATSLFFKPFGDALGSAILPFAKEGLDMAVQFNEIASDQGLGVAINFVDDSVKEKLGLAGIERGMENLTGLDIDFSVLEWSQFVNPLVWATFIPRIVWDNFVADINWGQWVDGINWDSYLDQVAWSDFIPEFSWQEFIHGGDESTTDSGTGGGGSSSSGGGGRRRNTPVSGGHIPGAPRGNGGGGGGGFDPDLNPFKPGNQDFGDLVVQLEADGRRLWNSTQRNANDLLDRI